MPWIWNLLGLTIILLANTSQAARKSGNFAVRASLNQSYDQISGVFEPLPAQERGSCSITDKYCSYNGTDRNPDGLSDQCMLWDSTCSGNYTLAVDQFFGKTQEYLYENVCFTGDGDEVVQSNCTRQNTPARYSEFGRIKSWMRSSQCIASQDVYQRAHPTPDTEGMQGEKRAYGKRNISTQGNNDGGGTCCGTCNIEAGNVDVYYWPESNANESCLSIIGNSINPPDYGATTDSLGLKYWGCTKSLTGMPDESVTTITTASVMVTGSMSWKAYLENPWDASLCPTTFSVSPGSNVSLNARAIEGKIHARGHTLVVPASATGSDGSPVTTVVSGSFTFTSPSIYAGFSSIGAYDSCGAEIISTTMLSFAPGELSTVVGPRYFGNIAATTLPFNFADLPCPPYSVASQNYYKPAPGEPYRPLIAIPSQVRTLVPWFQYCTDLWFTGFDPPRSLVPAAVMAPPVTTSHPADPTKAPQPSATQDSGAKQTKAVWDPIPLPSPNQHVPRPKKTRTLPDPKIHLPKETTLVPIIKPPVSKSRSTNSDPMTKHNDGSRPGSGSNDLGGQFFTQSGHSAKNGNMEDPEIPGVSKQGASRHPSAPIQTQDTGPAQFATVSAVQYNPQNDADPGDVSSPQGTTSADKAATLDGHALVVGPSGVVQVDGVKVRPGQILTGISGGAAINEGNSIVVASQTFYSATPAAHAATETGVQTTGSGSSTIISGGLIIGGFGHGGPSINSSLLVGSVPTSIRNSPSSGLLTFEGKAESLERMMVGKLAGLAIAIHLLLCLHISS